jgi:hypothetical protein
MYHRLTINEIMQRLDALNEAERILALNGTSMEAAELYARMWPEEPIFEFFLAEKRRYAATGQTR